MESVARTNMESTDRKVSELLEVLQKAIEDSNSVIEALQDILQPDGLLLMMNQNTHHVFSVIRKCGSIACTKSYSVPTDSMLQELKDSPNLIMLNDTGKHILDLLTPRQRNWLNAEHITAIYTLKYNLISSLALSILACSSGVIIKSSRPTFTKASVRQLLFFRKMDV